VRPEARGGGPVSAARAGLAIVVLAAGKGTRMRSRTAKVLHPLLGRPLLSWVLAALHGLPAGPRAVVVGHQAGEVARVLPPGFAPVLQRRLWGTGHAVRTARRSFAAAETVLVLAGDTPLLRPATLRRLLAAHRRRRPAPTLLTAELADPGGYGRIVRDGAGGVRAIVEHDDADDATRAIREVNAGVYCFEAAFLDRALGRLRAANRQEEYYLTDVVGLAVRAGRPVAAVRSADATEIAGVNDRVQLAQAAAALRLRELERLMRAGVTVEDPATTLVEPGVRVGADSVRRAGTRLEGATVIAAGCEIGPHAILRDVRLGRGARVRAFTVAEGAVLGPGAEAGPFARLRPGTVLGRGARVGNFVEAKKARLGAGTKAGHLSYLGDAVLGRGVNVGAGTITCNYDGYAKHETRIGDGVFVGSDTQLVAPVSVGRGAIVGAGTTVTRDVPADALALSRAPQENRPGYAARRRRLRAKPKGKG